MKALVYNGPGLRSWEEKPDPTIQDPTDIVVRIDSATICGTDLHILKGDVPAVQPGTVLGHEAVGTVVEIGAAVTTLEPGDRVLVSCITSCGRCSSCKNGRYGLCTGGGGWIFGHLIDGLQAEYARVPFADTSVYKLPDELSDEQVLFLADILPTAYEVGVLNGELGPGDTIAIVGAGPIGLATILTAKLYTPGRIIAIDLADSRLEKAREFGADETINSGKEDARCAVLELTGGLGADVAVEAVGIPETFELCTEIVPPGRPCRERGRARAPGDAPPRDALDPRPDDHDGPGRHVHHAAPAEADRGRAARRHSVRDAPVRARGHDGGVRHLRRGGRDRRAEGRARSHTREREASREGGCACR